MRIPAILLALGVPGLAAAASSTVTYHKDVAPILNQKCVECHRKGEAAPMALGSYQEVRPWAAAIKEAVVSTKMPPWLASPRYGHFRNDRRLSDGEKQTITEWVKAGTPEGMASDAKPSPIFTAGWTIGKPDMVFDLGTDFDVPADGVVPYKYFQVPSNFKEDMWVEAAEIRPDKREAVHHVIVFMLGPDGKRVGPDNGGDLLVGFAPGDPATVYEPGTAKRIRAGTIFRIQMHYTPSGKAVKDRSYFGLRFAKGPVRQEAFTGRAINGRFTIPPGAPNHEVRAGWSAPGDVEVHGFMPHMHLRGSAFRYTLVRAGREPEILLDIPKYNFAWQLNYQLAAPLKLTKGDRIECVAHYDNSANNRNNPDPTKEVRWGDQTWEEMMIGWLDYTLPAAGVGGAAPLQAAQ